MRYVVHIYIKCPKSGRFSISETQEFSFQTEKILLTLMFWLLFRTPKNFLFKQKKFCWRSCFDFSCTRTIVNDNYSECLSECLKPELVRILALRNGFKLLSRKSAEIQTSLEIFIFFWNLRVYIDRRYIGPCRPRLFTYLEQGTLFTAISTGKVHRSLLKAALPRPMHESLWYLDLALISLLKASLPRL